MSLHDPYSWSSLIRSNNDWLDYCWWLAIKLSAKSAWTLHTRRQKGEDGIDWETNPNCNVGEGREVLRIPRSSTPTPDPEVPPVWLHGMHDPGVGNNTDQKQVWVPKSSVSIKMGRNVKDPVWDYLYIQYEINTIDRKGLRFPPWGKSG